MGQVTTYSCGGLIEGDPKLLLSFGKTARYCLDNNVEPMYTGGIARLKNQQKFQLIKLAMSRQPHPFRIHSSLNNVRRGYLESLTEQELADRARPKFRELVQGLTRSEGHFGDVLVLGAHPVITADERGSELPSKDDPRYQTRPFKEALERYPSREFHVPYDVLLDLEGFTAWVLNSREDMGGHATRLSMIERNCGASV